eukprot:764017-Hanusia_phi.AAC.4
MSKRKRRDRREEGVRRREEVSREGVNHKRSRRDQGKRREMETRTWGDGEMLGSSKYRRLETCGCRLIRIFALDRLSATPEGVGPTEPLV